MQNWFTLFEIINLTVCITCIASHAHTYLMSTWVHSGVVLTVALWRTRHHCLPVTRRRVTGEVISILPAVCGTLRLRVWETCTGVVVWWIAVNFEITDLSGESAVGEVLFQSNRSNIVISSPKKTEMLL